MQVWSFVHSLCALRHEATPPACMCVRGEWTRVVTVERLRAVLPTEMRADACAVRYFFLSEVRARQFTGLQNIPVHIAHNESESLHMHSPAIGAPHQISWRAARNTLLKFTGRVMNGDMIHDDT